MYNSWDKSFTVRSMIIKFTKNIQYCCDIKKTYLSAGRENFALHVEMAWYDIKDKIFSLLVNCWKMMKPTQNRLTCHLTGLHVILRGRCNNADNHLTGLHANAISGWNMIRKQVFPQRFLLSKHIIAKPWLHALHIGGSCLACGNQTLP